MIPARRLIIAAVAVVLALTGCTARTTGQPSAPPSSLADIIVPTSPPASSSPSSSPAPVPGTVNTPQSITTTGLDGKPVKTTVTVHSATWTTGTGEIGDIGPKLGAYLVVDVSVEAVDGTATYNPFDWKAKDPEGRSYMPSPFGAPEPGLHSGSLEPGDLARGFMSFDMPQGPATLILGDRPGARWVIPAS